MLLAGLLVAATFFWLGRRDIAGNGPPELIHAPPGPYKVKPPTPGGLNIAGESETAFETSAGQDKDAQLDLTKIPESPVAKPAEGGAEAGFSAEVKAPGKAAAAPRAEADWPGAGSVIQLGAFANQAQAERAWSALSARFPSVAAMNKLVIPFSGGIRLRAAAAIPGGGQAGVPDAQGGGRKLLRRAIERD